MIAAIAREMSYPQRYFEPNGVYFITARCFQSRLLLRPSIHTNEICGATMARAARLFSVDVFAFVFTSNHFHLMIRAPNGGQLVRFMQFLLSNIARKVGKLVGWRNRFFERRYSAEPVLDDTAMIGRLEYILAHGVKEGLVADCQTWPGLHCASFVRSGQTYDFRWRNWTQRWFVHRATGENVDHFGDNCPSSSESLQTTPLPCWRTLSQDERAALIDTLIAKINASAKPSVLGVESVLAQLPHSAPAHTKRSPRPKCHASTLELWREFVHRYRRLRTAFLDASLRWRAGDMAVIFPQHFFRPPAPF